MKDRIFKVMKWTGLNLSQFADALQVSPALLSSVKSERTKPTLLLVENIKRIYPEIDINWLITGDGEMLVGSAPGGLHILTDETAKPAAESPYGMAGDSQAEETKPVNGSREPAMPEQEGAAVTGQTREVVSVEATQTAARPAVPPTVPAKDTVTPEKRTVGQVLLMYNDGTYESFQKQ